MNQKILSHLGAVAFALLLITDAGSGEVALREELTAGSPPGSLYIDTTQALERKYDRFPDDGSVSHSTFIGKDLDLSGCGKSHPKFATMISAKFYATSHHVNPTPNSNAKVKFYPGTSTAGEVVRYIADSTYLDTFSEDMGFGELKLNLAGGDGSIPNNIAFYPIVVDPPNLNGKDMNMMGQAYIPDPPSNPASVSFSVDGTQDGSARTNGSHLSQKMGRNDVHSYSSSSVFWSYKFDDPGQNDEFMARWSSSGGPSFIGYEWPGAPGTSVRIGTWGTGNNLCLLGTHYSGWVPTPIKSSWDVPPTENATASDVNTGMHFDTIRAKMIAWQPNVPEHELQLPISVSNCPGDFDGDSGDNSDDIDVLQREVRMHGLGNRGFCWYLDWNMDGTMGTDDVEAYVAERGWEMGDANCLGGVGFADYLILASNYNQGTGFGWADGDFTGDGEVQFDDFLILSQNWNGTPPPPPQ